MYVYISAVGEIDPFVKVPRPDGKPDNLGLTVLDETASTQVHAIIYMCMLSFSLSRPLYIYIYIYIYIHIYIYVYVYT